MTQQTFREQGDRDGVWRGIQQITVTLTDAQIKALPSTGIEVVAAPGTGKVILPVLLVLTPTIVIAYTNIADSSPQLYNPNGYGQGLSGVIGGFTELGVEGTFPRYVTGCESNVGSDTFDGYVLSSALAVENDSVVLKDNWNSGDYTDGSIANTMKVTVLYTIMDV